MTDGARNTIPQGNNSARFSASFEPLVAQSWVNYQSLKRNRKMTAQTQLSTFNFESKSIRTLAINNEPWFVAVDVCQALGLTQTTNALRNLDDDEVALTSIKGISKGNDQVNLVSESGMYTLILRCRDAVKKKDLFHTVLENGLHQKYYLLFAKQENMKAKHLSMTEQVYATP